MVAVSGERGATEPTSRRGGEGGHPFETKSFAHAEEQGWGGLLRRAARGFSWPLFGAILAGVYLTVLAVIPTC